MSYHGTHVVVIEIPEGSWGAGGSNYRYQEDQQTHRRHPGPKTPGRSTGERSQAVSHRCPGPTFRGFASLRFRPKNMAHHIFQLESELQNIPEAAAKASIAAPMDRTINEI